MKMSAADFDWFSQSLKINSVCNMFCLVLVGVKLILHISFLENKTEKSIISLDCVLFTFSFGQNGMGFFILHILN